MGSGTLFHLTLFNTIFLFPTTNLVTFQVFHPKFCLFCSQQTGWNIVLQIDGRSSNQDTCRCSRRVLCIRFRQIFSSWRAGRGAGWRGARGRPSRRRWRRGDQGRPRAARGSLHPAASNRKWRHSLWFCLSWIFESSAFSSQPTFSTMIDALERYESDYFPTKFYFSESIF